MKPVVQQLHRESQSARNRGDFAASESLDRQILLADPDFMGGHFNLSVSLYRQNKYEEAAQELLKQCTKGGPPELLALAYNNLGTLLERQGKIRSAFECYKEGIRRCPKRFENYNNFGALLCSLNRPEEALKHLESCLKLNPGMAEAHYNKSLTLLMAGQYELGLRLYEWRWQCPSIFAPKPGFPVPEWNGKNPEGKRICVYTEQGSGDAINFARFALELQEMGAKVVFFSLHKGLAPLLAGMGFYAVTEDPNNIPEFDFHISLGSLMRVLKKNPKNINGGPYIPAPEPPPWRLTGDFKVGLCWAGSKDHKADRWRSMPIDELTPLLELPGVNWYSLQVGERAADAEPYNQICGIHLRDYMATAVAMGELDLIITVDTSVAHLAGALGRPVWTLLSVPMDWRWGVSGQKTFWYDSMRLYRKQIEAPWKLLIDQVKRDLAELLVDRALPLHEEATMATA